MNKMFRDAFTNDDLTNGNASARTCFFGWRYHADDGHRSYLWICMLRKSNHTLTKRTKPQEKNACVLTDREDGDFKILNIKRCNSKIKQDIAIHAWRIYRQSNNEHVQMRYMIYMLY